MEFQLGEVIATRQLDLIENDGTRSVVLVRLGAPMRFPDSSDFYAPFQITGLGAETILCVGGIDAFQAIQEVMSVIGAKLFALNESSGGRLKWEGDEAGKLGFPVGGINPDKV
jgi:Domain of unknown function (DUF6968)